MGNGGLSVATFEMGDGLHMPQIGFGTFQIKEEEAEGERGEGAPAPCGAPSTSFAPQSRFSPR